MQNYLLGIAIFVRQSMDKHIWAMKAIGKENFSEELREKGSHIGNANEYWFGTDVANNFSNNIPSMYGT